ncbi:DEAD/DEAH box helicase [Aeromicrobium massiliense]|uniref:DEAD/DEAH box helicase n=1 Tax=Aeromicrobium massiliense TaxID=1464554 RepID=UPI000675C96B|nr:DEAD/DEAH box helicase [Aeromicrobium massiliense]
MTHPVGSPALPSFSTLGLPKPVVATLARKGIETPTPIQAAVLPDALAGRNVLGRAKTGSGKTLAFGLPVLAALAGGERRPKAPRGLILLPTRELATQVRDALDPVAEALGLRMATVYGGTSIERQIQRLRSGVDLVVATPGRLGDLIERRAVTLDRIEVTALDEADHLCDLGFYKPIDRLLAMTPSDGQRLLLSATLDGDVDRLVRRHLPQHVLHEIESDDSDAGTMDHHLMVTPRENRLEVIRALVEANPRAIVFTRTKRGATRLAKQLTTAGIEAVDMHGDLAQNRRERNLAKFSAGQASAIVATDVAARGIHVDDVRLVVHFDVPAEHKAFTHRSGRTARAGESGTVVTMTMPEDLRDTLALQRKAGVAARRHTAANAPRPMTAQALSTSGELPKDEPQGQHQPTGGRPARQGQGGGRPGGGGNRNRRRRPSGSAGGNRSGNGGGGNRSRTPQR